MPTKTFANANQEPVVVHNLTTDSSTQFEQLIENPPLDAKEAYFDPEDDADERQKAYIGSWWYFGASTLGGPAKAVIVYYRASDIDPSDQEAIYDELQIDNFIANSTGIVIAFIGHTVFKRFYKKKNSLNPFYRTFDTFSSFGIAIGDFLSFFPIPFIPNGAQQLVSAFLGSLLGLAFGLIGAPLYWLYREFVDKTLKHQRNFYAKTGAESHAKYTKTAMVTGYSVGKIIGFAATPNQSDQHDMNMGGAIGGVAGFFASLFGVPFINYYFNRKLVDAYSIEVIDNEEYITRKDFAPCTYLLINFGTWKLIFVDKEGHHQRIPITKVTGLGDALNNLPPYTIDDDHGIKQLTDRDKEPLQDAINGYHYMKSCDEFRHNYIRTGIVFGTFLGTILGYIAGLFIPGLNIFVSMTVFGAASGLGGGVYYGYKGKEITAEVHKKQYSDNSWDYATRATASLGMSIGGLIGFVIGLYLPIPGGAWIGSAIGSAIGWKLAIPLINKTRALEPKDKRVRSPWTIRVTIGASVGATIGGVIGFLAGFYGGPLGAMVGLSIGVYVGSAIGWVIGALYDAVTRKLLKKVCGMAESSAKEAPEKSLKKKSQPIPKNQYKLKPPLSNKTITLSLKRQATSAACIGKHCDNAVSNERLETNSEIPAVRVMPAQAGIHSVNGKILAYEKWTPAYAGMTKTGFYPDTAANPTFERVGLSK